MKTGRAFSAAPFLVDDTNRNGRQLSSAIASALRIALRNSVQLTGITSDTLSPNGQGCQAIIWAEVLAPIVATCRFSASQSFSFPGTEHRATSFN